MVYDFVCSCGHTQEENIPLERRNTAYVACERCSRQMRRVEVYLTNPAGASTFVPPHMQDHNISGNARNREWLKTKKAKDMNLVHQHEGDEG
jgi:hypothetical protein